MLPISLVDSTKSSVNPSHELTRFIKSILKSINFPLNMLELYMKLLIKKGCITMKITQNIVYFFNKILTALLASILFATLLGSLTYFTGQEYEGWNYPVLTTFFITLLYVTPVFLVLGIPSSILIEFITNRKTYHSQIRKLFIRFFGYIVLGLFSGLFVAVSVFKYLISYMDAAIYGIISATIYFIIQSALNGFWNKTFHQINRNNLM
jgi:hypothetical protein